MGEMRQRVQEAIVEERGTRNISDLFSFDPPFVKLTRRLPNIRGLKTGGMQGFLSMYSWKIC
jgi:hypothetical protein